MALYELWYSPDGLIEMRPNKPNRPIKPAVSTKVRLYRSGVTGSIAVPGATIIHQSNADSFTIRNPIANADMWSWINANYGSTSNFTQTSVIAATGRGNVINQHFTAGNMIDTGEGITLTAVPLPTHYTEASIEYDVMFTSTGTPWGWGGKLPGLGGIRPGGGGVPPTGGQPTPTGWSCRSMWITPAAGFSSENPLSPVEWIGYPYLPSLPSGSYGLNRRTRKSFVNGQWHTIKQYYKMNDVTTEGSTNPPANGIHIMWFDGVECFRKTDEVWRFYTNADITHMLWENFYGGAGTQWAPTSNVDIRFDNLKITTP